LLHNNSIMELPIYMFLSLSGLGFI
jgi:hypothetical protein